MVIDAAIADQLSHMKHVIRFSRHKDLQDAVNLLTHCHRHHFIVLQQNRSDEQIVTSVSGEGCVLHWAHKEGIALSGHLLS